MKWLKRLFFLFFLLLGLYFFGNFRINEVNVRDFLRTHLSPVVIIRYKDALLRVGKKVTGLVDFSGQQSSLTHQNPETKSSVRRSMAPREQEEPSLEQLTKRDQERLIKLLEQEIEKKK